MSLLQYQKKPVMKPKPILSPQVNGGNKIEKYSHHSQNCSFDEQSIYNNTTISNFDDSNITSTPKEPDPLSQKLPTDNIDN